MLQFDDLSYRDIFLLDERSHKIPPIHLLLPPAQHDQKKTYEERKSGRSKGSRSAVTGLLRPYLRRRVGGRQEETSRSSVSSRGCYVEQLYIHAAQSPNESSTSIRKRDLRSWEGQIQEEFMAREKSKPTSLLRNGCPSVLYKWASPQTSACVKGNKLSHPVSLHILLRSKSPLCLFRRMGQKTRDTRRSRLCTEVVCMPSCFSR